MNDEWQWCIRCKSCIFLSQITITFHVYSTQSFTFDSISGNIPDNLIPHDVSFDPLISIEDKTPSVLCGQLVSSGNCGLVIQDKTCSVQCMVRTDYGVWTQVWA